MERLTVKNWPELTLPECYRLVGGCLTSTPEPGFKCNGCPAPRLYVRLAQYEDTGLLPDEIDPRVRKPLKAKMRRKRR